MAAGEASGRTPVGPPLEALPAPSRADVSLMVAESTVFWRRKKFVGATPPELWLATWGVAAVEARLPAVAVVVPALVPEAAAEAAPEALALVAASRVSPPEDARRPVLDDVADIDRWTLRWPEALTETVAVPDPDWDEWPEDGTEDGPDAAVAASVRGGTPRNDNELPDLDPSLSNCQGRIKKTYKG